MLIKGFQKTTLLDFPGKVAATVFTGGCNFRCPFCHNASLVTHVDASDTFSEQEILDYLNKRKKILDGVCITGGEPLLQKDIADFCRKIKEIGLQIKMDTNGSYPERLRELIDAGLLDYVAMDVKNSSARYAETCGLNEEPEQIEKSIRLLMSCGIPYEFRTTVTKEFHDAQSLEELSLRIKGAKQYFLQCFTDSGDLIEDGLTAYSAEEMEELLAVVRQHIPHASLRGV